MYAFFYQTVYLILKSMPGCCLLRQSLNMILFTEVGLVVLKHFIIYYDYYSIIFVVLLQIISTYFMCINFAHIVIYFIFSFQMSKSSMLYAKHIPRSC